MRWRSKTCDRAIADCLSALLAAAAMLACASRCRRAGTRLSATRWPASDADHRRGGKEDLDDLPKTFDAAFPLWCRYFGLDAGKLADWHVTGYLMKSRERFERAGYWQADLPPFSNGFSAGQKFWLYDQASPYYRRHLLLHEGVHSFMYLLLGQGGPTRYMEGMAELLATHHWQDGQLQVGYFPASSGEVQQLGRIEIIQNAVAAGHRRGLDDVLDDAGLDRHRQRRLRLVVGAGRISRRPPTLSRPFSHASPVPPQGRFRDRISPPVRRRLGPAATPSGKPSWPRSTMATISIAWPSTFGPASRWWPRRGTGHHRRRPRLAIEPVALEAGKTYELSATGRYQIRASRPFGGASQEA